SKPVTFTQNSYPVSNYDFKAGPFIIYPSDTALAHLVIDMYNGSMASNEKINVFRTTAATSVDVRYDLHGVIPKAAILNDGGNAPIHISYMTAAAIPSMNYVTLYSATGLTAGCYTFASE